MTILAYFDKPMSTYLSSLFINSLKLIVFGTLYKYSGIIFFTILPPDLMYNMCKIRCGSHKLPIELGKYFSIDRSERICDLCNKEELGDVFH
jgi:hypothetical protein